MICRFSLLVRCCRLNRCVSSVQLMATGAAPLPSKVGDFMRTVFGANFVEGYGQISNSELAVGTASLPRQFSVIAAARF